jgi:hypothetical protein
MRRRDKLSNSYPSRRKYRKEALSGDGGGRWRTEALGSRLGKLMQPDSNLVLTTWCVCRRHTFIRNLKIVFD